jgi:hypothetical protein
VAHGLKAHDSMPFYLRKRTSSEFCDTSATPWEKDIPVTAGQRACSRCWDASWEGPAQGKYPNAKALRVREA